MESVESLGTVLDQVAETVIELYERQPNEVNRKKLIKLEAMLQEKLRALEEVKKESGHS